MTIQTGRDDCGFPEWTTPPDSRAVKPPENTLAVIVDLRGGKGTIVIFSKAADQADRYHDRVGQDKNSGNLVMVVPWDQEWWYFPAGETRIAYIRSPG